MSQSIGTRALKFVTDGKAMYAGMAAATSKLKTWSAGLAGAASGGLGKLKGAVGSALSSSLGIAGNVGKSMLSGLGSLLKVGAIGVGIAVVAGLAVAASHIQETLTGLAGRMRFSANPGQKGELLSPEQTAQASKAAGAIQRAITAIKVAWERVSLAVAPFIQVVGQLVVAIGAKLQPYIDKAARVFNTLGTIAAFAFETAVDWVLELVDSFGQWLGEVTGVTGSLMSIEEVATAAAHGVARGFAYAWDVVKAGAGGVSIVVGHVIKIFGSLVNMLGDVVALAKRLPDSVRPGWIDGLADGIQRFGNGSRAAGDAAIAWGQRQLDAFGQSAAGVDAWFERLGQRQAEALREGEELRRAISYTAVGAALKGSMEAASVEARFNTQNILNPQIAEQQRTTQATRQVEVAVRALPGQIGTAVSGAFGMI